MASSSSIFFKPTSAQPNQDVEAVAKVINDLYASFEPKEKSLTEIFRAQVPAWAIKPQPEEFTDEQLDLRKSVELRLASWTNQIDSPLLATQLLKTHRCLLQACVGGKSDQVAKALAEIQQLPLSAFLKKAIVNARAGEKSTPSHLKELGPLGYCSLYNSPEHNKILKLLFEAGANSHARVPAGMPILFEMIRVPTGWTYEDYTQPQFLHYATIRERLALFLKDFDISLPLDRGLPNINLLVYSVEQHPNSYLTPLLEQLIFELFQNQPQDPLFKKFCEQLKNEGKLLAFPKIAQLAKAPYPSPEALREQQVRNLLLAILSFSNYEQRRLYAEALPGTTMLHDKKQEEVKRLHADFVAIQNEYFREKPKVTEAAFPLRRFLIRLETELKTERYLVNQRANPVSISEWSIFCSDNQEAMKLVGYHPANQAPESAPAARLTRG